MAKKIPTLLLTALWMVFFMIPMSDAGPLEELQSVLPEKVLTWSKAEEDQFYDSQTIFDYIDGAGEVYRAYNMQRCLSRRYVPPEGPPIILDVFEMASSYDAFGVFTHDPDGEGLAVGQGAVYRSGWLGFWKDRFFVSLYADEDTEAAKQALRELAGKVASLIKKEGPKPQILSRLPKKGLQAASIRYFHDHPVLNRHYFISTENILRLGGRTEAVLATYQFKEGAAQILLVIYPDAEKAKEAYSSFLKHYLPDADPSGMARLENKKWCGASLKGSFLAVVLEADSREITKDLLGGLIGKDK
ncbi:MAG: hypothetical protein EHM26_09135 [Desulfobacteraceae bacterium]|nr:MAG: hypothetical protein EHM26_09135 [Desulfobacteraceae bacterium]